MTCRSDPQIDPRDLRPRASRYQEAVRGVLSHHVVRVALAYG